MKNNKLFLIAINTIPNPVVITDGEKIAIANDNFLNFFDYENLEDFVNINGCICKLFIKHKDYFSLDSIDKNVSWTDYLYSQKTKPVTVSILDKENNPVIFKISINKLEDNGTNYIVVFTNITAIHNEKKLLEEMAYIDPLTKTYNRTMFDKLFMKELENKKRYNDHLSLIMLDIDYFKKVNDTYGHDIGDKVLITLTKLINKHLRANDIFARWGGEEFLILLPRTDEETAYHKAKELRELIEKYKDEVIPKITVSFGVTEILESDKNICPFIRVDKALYQAKIKRNDVVKL